MKMIVLRLMLLLLGLYAGEAMAQEVKGVIKDKSGAPLPGVTVQVVGTTSGVSSDIDGKYVIKVVDVKKASLRFSFVGMKTQDVALDGKISMDVIMDDEATVLDEVVAIGYGTTKRKDLTGSVATVNAAELAAVPVASAAEAMTGKLAGVQITTTEGSPDAEMKIRVRGGGSITGDNTPLLIVDGFPVESISDIPASDIESLDVLKDASSTAIYGARGANGVVIVTTKSGKEGKTVVNYNAYYGFKKIAKTLDVLDPEDYVKWQYEYAALRNSKDLSSYEKYFGKYEDMDLYNGVKGNNWQDQVYGRTGKTFNHSLNITGGVEKLKYAFGYSHMDDKAIMIGSNFKRDNFSLKLNHKPNKRVSLDFSARYSDTKINGGGANEQNEVSSADSRMKHSVIYTPIPLKGISSDAADEDTFGDLVNPLTAIADNERVQKRKTFNVNGSFAWEIVDNLKVKTEFGMDDYRNNDQRFYGLSTYYVTNIPAKDYQNMPGVILTGLTRKSFRNTNTLSYDFKKILSEDHHLNILLGQENIKTQSKTLTSVIHGFPKEFTASQAFKLTTQGKAQSTDDFYAPEDKLISFFGRLNYDYQSKYIFSATLRADGSSKFTEGNRWGVFPSAAVAWRISSESFMGATKDWLDDLKLRFSFGTAGNNNIPSGKTTQVFTSNSTEWINGVNSYWAAGKVMANPDLKWETTYTRNLGLDFTLFNTRLSGTVEAYLNNTKDLLIEFPVSGTGYDSQYRNMGETQNKGLEVSLNAVAIDKKNYGLSFSFNIGFNRNEIKSLGIMDDFGAESKWASSEIGTDYWVAVGGAVGEIYGYKSDGRYEVNDFSGYDGKNWILNPGVADATAVVAGNGATIRPGTMKLKNIDGSNDNLVTTDDRTVIGNVNPKHTGGFAINARAYGFDLSANFNWSYGNDVYNANKIEYTSTSKYQYRNLSSMMADGKRWTNLNADGTISNDPVQLAEMNKNTTMWSPMVGRFVLSDWAVEDGSFLRLNTLTLGYTVPQELTRRFRVEKLRFYATGYNVFCWTNYSGFDPEVSTRRKTALTPGVDYSAYPKSRQIVFGLNLTF